MSLSRVLPILCSVMLTSCAETPEAPAPIPPTQLTLQINAGKQLNPDAAGKASPVLLRIYELREQSGFAAADFFMLFDKEQVALGGDLLRKQELLIKPGEQKTLPIDPAADTRKIGFFAAFRKLDDAQWRALAPLVPHQNNTVTLDMDRNVLSAKATAVDPAPPAPAEP